MLLNRNIGWPTKDKTGSKMSVNTSIRVCVLVGLYVQLLRANFALSLTVELQTCGLHLDSAKWSMHYTNGGLSSGLQTVWVMPPNHTSIEGEGNLNLIQKVGVPMPSTV